MKFYKYHALGNDYLVQDARDEASLPNEKDTIRICHRNFGLGSDGILYGPLKSDKADFGLRIINPDGSEAEKSGNGLRIFCRFLFDSELVKQEPFTIDTLGGVVTCQVFENGLIEVEMGKVTFNAPEIPVSGEAREVINEKIELSGQEWNYCCASIGNPHCVLPMDTVSKDLACDLGPQLENNTELFPNRINIQLLKVLDRENIQIEIWERGAGYTLASGSSSSAAGAVARKLGLVDENITVHMPGGQLKLRFTEDFAVTMTGPASKVADMDLDLECLKD